MARFRTAISFAMLASLACAGCNSAALVEKNRTQADSSERALMIHGSSAAHEAEWLFRNGALAPKSNGSERAPSGREVAENLRIVQLYGVYVPEHPSKPEVQIQSGWARLLEGANGVRWYSFYDRDWAQLATMSDRGVLQSPSGEKRWGEGAHSLNGAASVIFGVTPYRSIPTSTYDLATTLKHRTPGLRFEDEAPRDRGVRTISSDPTASVRPMGSGELGRMGGALSRQEFERQEAARMAALRADRERAAKARELPKPAAR